MITDNLKHIENYKGISRLLDAAIDLAKEPADGQAVGKYEVEGKDLFYLISEYTTKPLSDGVYESHRRYLDLQVILEGVEYLGFADTETLLVTEPYIEGRDIEFYKGEGKIIKLEPGDFYIVFPNDAHMPCCNEDGSHLRKKIIKIAIK